MLGCEDLRNHQPHSGYIWEHNLRVYRGVGGDGQDRLYLRRPGKLSRVMPHIPRHAFSPCLPSGSLLSHFWNAPPLPHAVHQHAGAETGLCSFPLRASSPATSPMACHVSGTLKWPPPSLSSQAFLQAGMACPPGLPWGSCQSLARKVTHRCQSVTQMLLPPLHPPSFPPPPLPHSSFLASLAPLTHCWCHALTHALSTPPPVTIHTVLLRTPGNLSAVVL